LRAARRRLTRLMSIELRHMISTDWAVSYSAGLGEQEPRLAVGRVGPRAKPASFRPRTTNEAILASSSTNEHTHGDNLDQEAATGKAQSGARASDSNAPVWAYHNQANQGWERRIRRPLRKSYRRATESKGGVFLLESSSLSLMASSAEVTGFVVISESHRGLEAGAGPRRSRAPLGDQRAMECGRAIVLLPVI